MMVDLTVYEASGDRNRLANSILYKQAVLSVLKFEDSSNLLIWEIRLKVVNFIIKRYLLHRYLDPRLFTADELLDIRKNDPLFKVPSVGSYSENSEELNLLKDRFRRLFSNSSLFSQSSD
jgi:hypothetical protein